jgi:ACS family glucarate transporter-like MFS transporter
MRTVTAIAGVAVTSIGLYIAAHTPSAEMNIFWMTVSLGALGFSMNASWSTVISLGGQYTGSVSGWMNLWGQYRRRAGSDCNSLLCYKLRLE